MCSLCVCIVDLEMVTLPKWLRIRRQFWHLLVWRTMFTILNVVGIKETWVEMGNGKLWPLDGAYSGRGGFQWVKGVGGGGRGKYA